MHHTDKYSQHSPIVWPLILMFSFVSCNMLSNLPLSRQVYDKDNSCVIECIIVHFYCAGSGNCFQFS